MSDHVPNNSSLMLLMTAMAVSELLGISVKTLGEWRSRGFGPQHIRLGRTIRYHPHAVAAFISSNGSPPPSSELERLVVVKPGKLGDDMAKHDRQRSKSASTDKRVAKPQLSVEDDKKLPFAERMRLRRERRASSDR